MLKFSKKQLYHIGSQEVKCEIIEMKVRVVCVCVKFKKRKKKEKSVWTEIILKISNEKKKEAGFIYS